MLNLIYKGKPSSRLSPARLNYAGQFLRSFLKCRGENSLLSRRAKYLILHTDKGDIIVHLGMSGSLGILEASDNLHAGKHDHVDLITESGVILLTTRVSLVAGSGQRKQMSTNFCKNLGLNPYLMPLQAVIYSRKVAKKTVAVKNFIMNNDVVVGVGNIYACESLFMAGIHPELSAQNLTNN